jgi:isopenicillin N synthase-like dioxygenase
LPGQPGLEIKIPSGEWAAVPVDPKGGGENTALPILVNIGDLLEDWTGGLLKSTVHRVIFPKGEAGNDRYSIAYFCHPLDDAELQPVPSKRVQEHAAVTGKGGMRNGRVLTAKDHLMERLAATYSIK